MRPIFFLLPLLIAANAPPSADAVGKGCLNRGVIQTAARPDPSGFRRLDQLPPANEVLTVIKLEDGCMKPVIVRYDVGNAHPSGR